MERRRVCLRVLAPVFFSTDIIISPSFALRRLRIRAARGRTARSSEQLGLLFCTLLETGHGTALDGPSVWRRYTHHLYVV
jgi:hypothetical protein